MALAAEVRSARGQGLDPAAGGPSEPGDPGEPTETGQPAQSAPDPRDITEFSLEELLNAPISTASGEVEQRSMAAATVFVITAEEIERRGWRSLHEILQQVPGLYVVDDQVHPSVSVREVSGGFRGGTRLIKVMIDGYPISFRPDLNAFIGPEFIPVQAIERVEVAKGPLSALYGANAFLATVNVITREPSASRSGAQLHLSTHAGRLGYGGAAMSSFGDASKGVLVAINTERLDRSGLRLRQSFSGQDPASPMFQTASDKDFSEPFGAYLRVHAGSERLGKLVLSGGYQHLDAAGEFQLNSVLTHRTRVALDNRWLNAQYSHSVHDQLKLRALLGASAGEPGRDYRFYLTGNTDSVFRPNYGYRALNALLEMSYAPLPALSAKAGVDGELASERILFYTQTLHRPEGMRAPLDEIDLIGADDARSARVRQIGAYLQLSGNPLPDIGDLVLTGNGRVDFIRFGEVGFPSQYSWRAAVAYRWNPRLTTKMVAGRAFQTPSGTLLFAHGAVGNFQNVIGSQRLDEPTPLRPQSVRSLDLSATAQVGSRLTVEATAFQQYLDDAIEFVQVGPFFVARNRGSRTITGLELTMRAALFGAVFPYLVGDVTSSAWSGAAAPQLYPSIAGRLGVDLDVWQDVVGANLELRWTGPRGASQGNVYRNDSRPYQLPSYLELDVTARLANLHLLSGQLATKLLVSLKNALGQQRLEPGFGGIDLPQRGRTLFISVHQDL